jgi:hypothetical protein
MLHLDESETLSICVSGTSLLGLLITIALFVRILKIRAFRPVRGTFPARPAQPAKLLPQKRAFAEATETLPPTHGQVLVKRLPLR